MNFIFNRLKAIILIVIGAIRRALCCFRMRRRSHTNEGDDCLTDVGIVPNRNEGEHMWDVKWGNEPISRPQTIQDHIQMYRDKIAHPPMQETKKEDKELDNLFQEMTPQYIKQKRVLINNSGARSRSNDADLSRLSVSEDGLGGDLGEWVEESASGWDEQQVDPLEVIREQRRIKRESRQQSTTLGKKLKT